MNKFFNFLLGFLCNGFVVLNFLLIVSAQAQEHQATRRTCKGDGCGAISRAELFIKTFASSGNSKGLRTTNIKQEIEVEQAFYNIDALRLQIERGNMTEQRGNSAIDSAEGVIRWYVHNKTDDAMVSASSGRVSDIPAITKNLSGMLSVARQDALMGHEELAQEAQANMVKILTTFSQKFAETCEQQTFPVEVALGLERQNELMGTNISVMDCANRKYTAQFSDLGLKYRFETCRSPLQEDFTVWNETISGHVGEGSEGGDVNWEEKIVIDKDVEENIKITEEEIEDNEETVKIPNDAGPNAKPNGWASAPIPNPPSRHLKKIRFMTMRKPVPLRDWKKDGFVPEWVANGPWMEAEIKSEDKPCSPVTEP